VKDAFGKTREPESGVATEEAPPSVVEDAPTPAGDPVAETLLAEGNGHAPRPPEILRTTTRELPCHLTNDEKAKLAGELVAVIEKAEQEEIEQDKQKKEMKSILAGYAATQSRLARMLRNGIEQRPVEVRIEALYDVGKARTIRTDTGEVVEERPLTDSERQPPLIPEVAQAAEAAGVVHSEAAEAEDK